MRKILLALILAAGAATPGGANVVKVSGNSPTHVLSGNKPVVKGLHTGMQAHSNKAAAPGAPTRAQEAADIPWSVDFSTSDLIDFTIVDANEDGITWAHDENQGEVYAQYSAKDPMDDWLITPPMTLTGGKAYTLKFMAACNSQAYPERLEILYGDAPTVAAMTSTALQPMTIDGIDLAEYSCVIVPRMSGKVYVGFHGISDANMYKLRISRMSITEGASGETPSGVKDLMVTSSDPYSLNATVSFYAPETTMSGATLNKIDNITLKRDGVLLTTFPNPTPGEHLHFDDTAETGGLYTYSVCASNSSGEGYVMTCTHTIGGVAPLYPENVVLKEIEPAGTLRLTWDPVTTDIEGNRIPDGFVRYIVVDTDMEVIAQDLTETEVVFHLATDQQIFVEAIVAAYTVGGLSEGTMSNLVAAGPALTDFKESFPDGNVESLMGIGYEFGYVDYVSWGLADDTTFSAGDGSGAVTASDGDNGFAFMQCEYRDTGSSIFTGKITLPDEGPAIYFDIFNQSLENIPDLNQLDLMVSEDGFNWDTVHSATVFDLCGARQGWHQVVVGLHDYAGKTVQIRWQVTVQSFATFLIDAIHVATLPDHDLKAEKFVTPETAAAGDEISLHLCVLNIGAKDADSYDVLLFVNDDQVSRQTCGKLAAGKRADISIPYTVSPVCESTLEISAIVVFDRDCDTGNNVTPVRTLRPEFPRYPYVTDLSGGASESGIVSLTWSEPYLDTFTPGALEDFESGTDFAHEFGDWIFIDRDQLAVGNINPSVIPGIEPGVTTASFIVLNDEEPTFNSAMKAYSGHKYIASIFSYYNEMVDDWAITPALNGAAQIISFRARSLESYYAETMELYYSFGSTNPDDFILITRVDKVPGEWTEYNIPVPTGAKRFAVRSHSAGAMLLLLDDFFFADSSAPVGIELEKYNIYCDGRMVGTVAGDETSFSHQGETGEHTYAVTAVYKDLGESKSSNKVLVNNQYSSVEAVGTSSDICITSADGAIRISGLQGEGYSVVTPAGVCVARGIATGEATIPVAPGMYVVKAASTTSKAIVK